MNWKTGNQLGIVPRVIPILKWSFLPVGRAIQLNLTRMSPPTDITSKTQTIRNSIIYRCTVSHEKQIKPRFTKYWGKFAADLMKRYFLKTSCSCICFKPRSTSVRLSILFPFGSQSLNILFRLVFASSVWSGLKQCRQLCSVIINFLKKRQQ